MPLATDADLSSLAAVAAEAVRLTRGYLAEQRRGPVAVVSQQGRDIKLAADAVSEAMIRAFLASRTDLAVLGEEGGWGADAPAADALHWVLDPLDGSFNYLRGVPLYAVSLALCLGRQTLFGAVYDPERDELFTGGPGLGLWLNGVALAQPAAVRQMVATGFPSQTEVGVTLARLTTLAAEWTKMRMLGSAALSLAWVAAGRLDGYGEAGILWWDVAAGLALAQGSGARQVSWQPVPGGLAQAVDVFVAR